MNTMPEIFDYTVYDRDNEKVGIVEAVWRDAGDNLQFVGISTGWLGLGLNHIIPAVGMTVNTADEAIRVPFGEDVIKTSPSYAPSMDLTDLEEIQLYGHYGVEGRAAASVKRRREDIKVEPELSRS
jgi:hypothetical protein